MDESMPPYPCTIAVINCVRPKGERTPNFVFASCVFRVGVSVYGYAELFEIAVRTPKWPSPLDFCSGVCRPGNWCELMTTCNFVRTL